MKVGTAWYLSVKRCLRWACLSVSLALKVIVGQIHRYRLASDGSAFGSMFTLPSGEKCPNSTTEDEPLILQDSIDEFRALCWALYALYVNGVSD